MRKKVKLMPTMSITLLKIKMEKLIGIIFLVV